ncbi:hypothetical protein [Prevotella melaninogenica]|uniref:hypothetical protein n=1 Tax=Prevotella melaninogenica TaxID=28132 RepID=UPI001BA5A025|nr:hypothetical protein [Prevotella melaninogenica]QUB64915.1 hypothetical protein J5A57_04925 [Prevotella melaninogenica]
MSKTGSLHYRLCCEGAKWMRKQEWGTYHTVAVELCTVNVENPDVWGTTGFKSMLIEVKTSRADFLKVREYGRGCNALLYHAQRGSKKRYL